ncbi:MAG: hypothetical protein LBG72_07520, partial [Spirochaetaceae bacterium]|nr:hypothetical protein [Spirochaetaceae bacterium]
HKAHRIKGYPSHSNSSPHICGIPEKMTGIRPFMRRFMRTITSITADALSAKGTQSRQTQEQRYSQSPQSISMPEFRTVALEGLTAML